MCIAIHTILPFKIAIWLQCLFCLHYRLSNIHIPYILLEFIFVVVPARPFLPFPSFHFFIPNISVFFYLARLKTCMSFLCFDTFSPLQSSSSLMVFLFIVIVHFYLFWTNNNLCFVPSFLDEKKMRGNAHFCYRIMIRRRFCALGLELYSVFVSVQ